MKNILLHIVIIIFSISGQLNAQDVVWLNSDGDYLTYYGLAYYSRWEIHDTADCNQPRVSSPVYYQTQKERRGVMLFYKVAFTLNVIESIGDTSDEICTLQVVFHTTRGDTIVEAETVKRIDVSLNTWEFIKMERDYWIPDYLLEDYIATSFELVVADGNAVIVNTIEVYDDGVGAFFCNENIAGRYMMTTSILQYVKEMLNRHKYVYYNAEREINSIDNMYPNYFLDSLIQNTYNLPTKKPSKMNTNVELH